MVARIVADTPAGRAEAIAVLASGGLVGLPTDTVYGIAVAGATAGGIERLFAAKGRPPERAIVLLLAEAAQAAELAVIGPAAAALASAFWPGGLTLVLERRVDVADVAGPAAGPRPTIGLRVPNHPAPRALAAALGPLPTTSANRSGEPEANDAAEVRAVLGDELELVLDGGPAPGGRPSSVVDASGAVVRILREGAIGADAIRRVLETAGLPDAVGR